MGPCPGSHSSDYPVYREVILADRLEGARSRIRLMRATDQVAVGDLSGLDTGSESFVQQQFANECDVNTIVRRFGLTGQGPIPASGGVYGDFTGIHDYESALAAVSRAEEGFMALPAGVRERFQNDPARFLSWSGGRTVEELARELPELAPPAVLVPQPSAPVAPAAAPPAGGEGA